MKLHIFSITLMYEFFSEKQNTYVNLCNTDDFQEPVKDCDYYQQKSKVACLLQGNIFLYIQLDIHKTLVVMLCDFI